LTLSKSNDQYQLIIRLDNSLVGNILELARGIDKFLPNFVSKLDCHDEVAYTAAEAHHDLGHSAVIAA
jgi:hypothetical protein